MSLVLFGLVEPQLCFKKPVSLLQTVSASEGGNGKTGSAAPPS